MMHLQFDAKTIPEAHDEYDQIREVQDFLDFSSGVTVEGETVDSLLVSRPSEELVLLEFKAVDKSYKCKFPLNAKIIVDYRKSIERLDNNVQMMGMGLDYAMKNWEYADTTRKEDHSKVVEWLKKRLGKVEMPDLTARYLITMILATSEG